MLNRAATFRRYTATLLVALWVLPLLVALGHSQEHAHRYCPEHQAFEETGRGSGEWQPRLSGSAPALSSLRPDAAEGVDPARATHETCPLLTASTRGEALAPETASVVTACLAASHPATAPPRALSSVPILATAPKSSPPARA